MATLPDPYNPSDAHRALRDMIRRFVVAEVEPQAKQHDEDEAFNEPLFRRLGSELSLFGLTVPASDGGLGLDPVATVIVCEELSRSDPALTLSYLAHEVLFINNVYWSANTWQRSRFLPPVIAGREIAGMAMTEPDAGTDVLGMGTTGRRQGETYILSGTKQFITNGSVGDLFLIYAKLNPARDSLTAFVVRSDSPGFSVGRSENKMGMRASPTAQLILDNCIVPAENLLGNPNEALVHMMRNLEIERVALAAQSVGIALRCIDEMMNYSRTRQAFGKPIVEFGQVKRRIASAYAETHAARAAVYDAARQISPGKRLTLNASAAKLVASRAGERAARHAIQILGGYGYLRDYPVERLLRDAILLSIGGGTSEAMEKNIVHELVRLYS